MYLPLLHAFNELGPLPTSQETRARAEKPRREALCAREDWSSELSKPSAGLFQTPSRAKGICSWSAPTSANPHAVAIRAARSEHRLRYGTVCLVSLRLLRFGVWGTLQKLYSFEAEMPLRATSPRQPARASAVMPGFCKTAGDACRSTLEPLS